LFWTTPAFTSRRARKNWWPTRAVNCSSCPLTRPISTRSNTSGPGSKRPCAASFPSPKTRPGQFPICVNVMLVSYSHAYSHVYGVDIYKLGGHYDPGGTIKNPLDGLGGDAAGPDHERFGDQGLHNVRLGVCHSAVTD